MPLVIAYAVSETDARTLARLLGRLEAQITDLIESTLMPGEQLPRERWLRPSVHRDYADRKEARRLRQQLLNALRRESSEALRDAPPDHSESLLPVVKRRKVGGR
jgi:hypothetical protein